MRIGALTLFVCLASIPSGLRAADPLQISNRMRVSGDYAGAEKVLREALTGEQDSAPRAVYLNTLADLLREEDRGKEARPYFEAVLQMDGVNWFARFGATMGLADLARQENAWDTSIARWNEARAMAVKNQNPMLESFALRGLGETWLDRGDTARAEPLLKRCLTMAESNPGMPPYRLALALDTSAGLYRAEGKTSMAEDLWARELEIDRKQFGDYHPQTALAMGHLAEVWSAEGDFERARDYSRQATEIMKVHFSEHSSAVASALANQALVEQRARQLETAAGLYKRAFDILEETQPSSDVSQTVARMYAHVLSELHRGREAKQVVAASMAFQGR